MNERLKKLMGLLNTPMNQGGGLLGNIPQGALLGAAMYGQGIQGKDPLAGLFPAYMQTAQLQKLMTPKASKPNTYVNKETGKRELVTPEMYAQNPELYAPDKKEPLVKIEGDKFEDEYSKIRGGQEADYFGSLMEKANTAHINIPQYDLIFLKDLDR